MTLPGAIGQHQQMPVLYQESIIHSWTFLLHHCLNQAENSSPALCQSWETPARSSPSKKYTKSVKEWLKYCHVFKFKVSLINKKRWSFPQDTEELRSFCAEIFSFPGILHEIKTALYGFTSQISLPLVPPVFCSLNRQDLLPKIHSDTNSHSQMWIKGWGWSCFT